MYFTDSRKERSHGKARSNGLVMDWGIGEQGHHERGQRLAEGFRAMAENQPFHLRNGRQPGENRHGWRF